MACRAGRHLNKQIQIYLWSTGYTVSYIVMPEIPFLGSPLPLPRRDFLSSSLLFGLVGGAVVPRTPSPLSLSESPRPESREEFFLRRRLTLAFSLASWRLEVGAEIQLPLISLSIFRAVPFSSSPDRKESLRSSASVRMKVITYIKHNWTQPITLHWFSIVLVNSDISNFP